MIKLSIIQFAFLKLKIIEFNMIKLKMFMFVIIKVYRVYLQVFEFSINAYNIIEFCMTK